MNNSHIELQLEIFLNCFNFWALTRYFLIHKKILYINIYINIDIYKYIYNIFIIISSSNVLQNSRLNS